MAAILFENVQSILNCTSYSFADEDTLDHDFNIELAGDNSTFENNEDDDRNIDDDHDHDHHCNSNDDSHDNDYNDKCKNENIVRHQFSLEYVKNVMQFYDERNPKIRKWNNIRKDKYWKR